MDTVQVQSSEFKSVAQKDGNEPNEKMPDVVPSSEEGKAPLINEDVNNNSSREGMQTKAPQNEEDDTSSSPPTAVDDIAQKKHLDETKAGNGWGWEGAFTLYVSSSSNNSSRRKWRRYQQ